MTVLNKIIQQVEYNEAYYWTFNEVLRLLKDNLPAEQQQIRDAWKAALTWKASGGTGEEINKLDNAPDLETYIQSLNQ